MCLAYNLGNASNISPFIHQPYNVPASMPGLPGRIMISASSRLGATGFDSLQPQMEVEDDEGGECSEESSEDDNGHYEPRPQLSEPQVSELSLEKVISQCIY